MATPYGQTPPRVRRRHGGGVVGPLILIFIGGVFLLQNAGVLPPSVWGNLWRLWPLVLVLAGLELLIGRRVPWLFAIGGLVIVICALFVAASSFSIPGMPRAEQSTQTFVNQLDNAHQASVTVRFGAGQLSVGPQTNGPPSQLASMSFTGPADLVPTPSYSVVGDTGRLDYTIQGRSGINLFGPFGGGNDALRMAIDLAPSVPITTLTIQAGATDARIDLSSLTVNNLEMAVGAASTWVRMPESGVTSAHISGGASNITVEVPPNVAARIRHSGGLSGVKVDETRFPAVGGDINQSPDWDSAANKVDLTIDSGITTIQVN